MKMEGNNHSQFKLAISRFIQQTKLIHNYKKKSMGNHQNKDSRVRLYLTLQRPFIYAGQYLQGTAHAEILEDVPYQSINISFVGKEKVQWSQTYEKLITSHKNQKETYRQELVLDVFENGLQKGHYSFPFNMLIPASLPASVQLDQNNYIAYILTVFLPPYDSQSSKQSFQLSLHIRQPLRSIFSTMTEGTTISKCCGCFGNQTSGLFQIEADRNQIHYTESFKVTACVNNKQGEFSFDRIGLVFTRRITKVSDSGAVQNVDEDIGIFYRSKQAVNVGRRKKFQIDLTLPARVVEHTAIGNILSRCYFISLIGQVGCCYNNARIYKHMILNNEVPPTKQQNIAQKQPQNWNPMVKSTISFVSLKPYVFNPSPEIKHLNQKGSIIPSMIHQQMSAKSLYRIE